MPDTPIITLKMLRGACSGQRKTFRREWPKGAPVTLENVKRALELGLDLNMWGAHNLFSQVARVRYQGRIHVLAERYNEATDPAYAAFNEACISAGKVRDEALLAAHKVFKAAAKSEDPELALIDYRLAIAAIHEDHDRSIAPAANSREAVITAAEYVYYEALAEAWLAGFLATYEEAQHAQT